LIKTLIWSIITYGRETCIIEKEDKTKLEAAEMWFWRKMHKTSWRKMKTNEAILNEIQEQRQLIKSIEHRRIKLIGHIILHDEFICNIFEGRSRPRKSYFKDLEDLMHNIQGIKELGNES